MAIQNTFYILEKPDVPKEMEQYKCQI